jgi:hypothetical protein
MIFQQLSIATCRLLGWKLEEVSCREPSITFDQERLGRRAGMNIENNFSSSSTLFLDKIYYRTKIHTNYLPRTTFNRTAFNVSFFFHVWKKNGMFPTSYLFTLYSSLPSMNTAKAECHACSLVLELMFIDKLPPPMAMSISPEMLFMQQSISSIMEIPNYFHLF